MGRCLSLVIQGEGGGKKGKMCVKRSKQDLVNRVVVAVLVMTNGASVPLRRCRTLLGFGERGGMEELFRLGSNSFRSATISQ